MLTYIGSGFIGTSPTRIIYPTAMKFDQQHNLYVVDGFNNRIQRFDLLYNGCWLYVKDKQFKCLIVFLEILSIESSLLKYLAFDCLSFAWCSLFTLWSARKDSCNVALCLLYLSIKSFELVCTKSSVDDASRSGRPTTVRTEENAEFVFETFHRNPQPSQRRAFHAQVYNVLWKI